MTAPMTNRQIETAAIAYVIRREAQEGREAHDTRGRGAAGDLMGGGRVIEVKAYGTTARGSDMWLEPRQVEEAKGNPDFWVYIVENVRQGDPSLFTLVRIGGDDLQDLVIRAREKHYYEAPLPVAVYDRLRADAST